MKISRITIAFILVLLFACKPGQEKIDKMVTGAMEKILKGDNNGAIEDLTKVIGYQENNYQAYFYRANAKFNLKLAKDALEDYNKALELKPDFADGFYNRAYCKQFLGDKDGACEDWNQAMFLGKPNVKDMLNYCP